MTSSSFASVVAFSLFVLGSTASADENPCLRYGYSGRTENAQSCRVDSPTRRTITCKPNFFPVVAQGRDATAEEMQKTTITLISPMPFFGCKAVTAVAVNPGVVVDRSKVLAASKDKCQNPGYSGKTNFVVGCKPIDGGRVITCKDGFYPMAAGRSATLSDMRTTSITLMGDIAFDGCRQASMCQLHGYNGMPKNVRSCNDGPNQRTITCNPGYFPVPADRADQIRVNGASLTLIGAAKFSGCVQTPG